MGYNIDYQIMQEFQQKQKIRRMLYSKQIFFIMIVVTIFFFRGAWGVWQKQLESSKKMHDAEARLALVSTRKDELSKDIKRLSTAEGVEREIRQRYSVKRQGEEVILVVDPKLSTSTEDVERSTFWEKTMQWIKGLF